MIPRERDTAREEALEGRAPVEVSLTQRFMNWRTYASFLFAAGIMALAVSRFNINLADARQVLERADLPLYLAALLVYYASFPLRALRWRQMLCCVGYRLSSLPGIGGLSEVIFLSWFVNSLVPAKLGDLYRAYLLKKSSDVSYPRVMGTVLGERVVDTGVLLAMLLLAGLLAFRGHFSADVSAVLFTSAGLVLAGVGTLLAMRHGSGLVEGMLPVRFRAGYVRFAEGTLGSLHQLPLLITLSAGAWLLEAGRLFLVTRALGISLSPDPWSEAALIVFLGLGAALLTVPPGTPAGLGYAEAGMTAVLISLDLPPVEAASLTLLDRSLSYGSIVVFGAIVYLFSRRK